MVFTMKVAYSIEIVRKAKLTKFSVEIPGQAITKFSPERWSHLLYIYDIIYIHHFACEGRFMWEL